MTKTLTHLHSCTRCRNTYEDACATPKRNDECNPCRSGIASFYAVGRFPIACCFRLARLARKDEIKAYRLAGDRPWFLCGQCRRQFGYDPTKDPQ